MIAPLVSDVAQFCHAIKLEISIDSVFHVYDPLVNGVIVWGGRALAVCS